MVFCQYGLRYTLLVLMTLMATMAQAEPMRAKLWEGAGETLIGTDPAAVSERCILADLSALSGLAFDAETPVLKPGLYRAILRLKLPVINHVNTAPLNFTLTIAGAGTGMRAFDILLIEKAGVYQEIPCAFEVTDAGKAQVSLTWRRKSINPERKAEVRPDAPKLPGQNAGLDDNGEDADMLALEAEIADEPPIDGVRFLYGAIDEVRIELLADAGTRHIDVDKIRYRPGEQPRITAEIHNFTEGPRTLRVLTTLVHGMATVIPVDERQLTLAGGAAETLSMRAPACTAKWGYAARIQVFEGTKLLTDDAEYFTVHDNMWAVAINGKGPAQFTAHVTKERAMASAKENKRRYRNWVESGFWAPDEFGDFTPDSEYWWGGQGNYYGSVTGTKLQIEEGHKLGIAFAVYSNIWGGDGPPAFEMVRADPDFGYPRTFSVDWFENWDRNTMGTGKPGLPMHVWPITIIRHEKSDRPALWHAKELVESHRTLGWDAVRYDSHGISDDVAKVMRVVKDAVWKELPNYQFGYNSSVVGRDPAKTAAFKSHCENGALIMEEGIRQFGGGGLSYSGGKTYEEFARRILDFKEEARENGGHFLAIGLDECYPNDLAYQYIIWFASNTHPCYDWKDSSVANYAQFATRYAGILWDLNVKPVKDAHKHVDFGDADFIWLWRDYVHERELANGRRQLIVHLINAPAEKVLFTNDDCKVPPPRLNVPIRLTVPTGAQVEGVWFLTPEHELTQQRLETEVSGQNVTVTVPKIRFWSTVVMETSAAP